MKQRLLVMNGQRLVQSEQEGQWVTDKVEKAGAVKPGIYNIHLSNHADMTKVYEGMFVYADKTHIYQQVDKGFVKHDRSAFGKAPDIGSNSSVRYEEGKALVSAQAMKLSRTIG